jgi:5-(carboxyamino)imidazole ribonucleotide synthase
LASEKLAVGGYMQRVGVIGGGQLARMMQPAAIALGINLSVFAESEGSSAHGAVTKVGDYTDLSPVARICQRCGCHYL